MSSRRLFLPFIVFSLMTFLLSGCFNNAKNDIFVNQDGKEIRITDFKGKSVVLLNFIRSACPNTGCELLTMQFLRVQTLLKNRIGDDLFLLSVIIDPENSTPAVIDEAVAKYKVDSSGWHFLVGDKDVTDRIMKEHGVAWKTNKDGERHHKVVIALFNRQGKKVTVYNDKNYNTLEMVKDIKKLLGPKS